MAERGGAVPDSRSLRGASGHHWARRGHGQAALSAMQQTEPVAEPMPGYGQLLRLGYGSLAAAVRSCNDCGWELARTTWAENAHLGWGEVLLCGLAALGWTALRRAAARRLFRVGPRSEGFGGGHRGKREEEEERGWGGHREEPGG